jgi:hypothetical protein
VLGLLNLSRAYYHCPACGTGFCPRDRALGLQGESLTPGVLRMVGQVEARVSFEEGHELLTELAGLDISTKTGEVHGDLEPRASPRKGPGKPEYSRDDRASFDVLPCASRGLSGPAGTRGILSPSGRRRALTGWSTLPG